jgi:branched-chain amino acid transport system permease protein
MFSQFLINGFITGLIYSVAGLGFAFVYNTTKTFHIAYSALCVLPAYIFLTAKNTLGLNFFFCTVLSLSVAVLISILIEVVVYKPLERKKSSVNVITVSSIGVMTVIINLIAMIYGNDMKTIRDGISGSVRFFNIVIVNTQLYQLVISVLLIAAFGIVLNKTRFGITTRALSNDQELTAVLGLNRSSFRIILFGLSGLFAGTASLLTAWDVGMDPYVGMPMLLNAVVALIIGGVGDFRGTVAGGIFIGLMQSGAVYFASSKWQTAITFFILILFLLFRPQGIFGKKLRSV